MSLEIPRTNFPNLPSELWERILRLHHDLVHLWCSCRQVSRGFRSIVDLIFETEYLAKTSIDFDLGWDYLNQRELTMKCMFAVHCTFDHLSDNDKEVAVFKDKEWKAEIDPKLARRMERMERRKWMEKVNLYTGGDDEDAVADGGRFDLPPWLVAVYDMVNDTALPEWKIDYEMREVSFRWKEMLQCIFREQEYINKKVLQFAEASLASLKPDLRLLFEKSRMVPEVQKEARKEIRRHRIKKFYKEFHDFDMQDFDPDEAACLLNIEQRELELRAEYDPFAMLQGMFGDDEAGSKLAAEILFGMPSA